MLRRCLLALLSLGLVLFPALAVSAETADVPHPPPGPSLDALCTAGAQLADPSACPDVGPAAHAARLAALGLTSPPAPLPVYPVAPPHPLVPFAYARVVTPGASVFESPEAALTGVPPKRQFQRGFVFVSLANGGTPETYAINGGEHMLAADLKPVQASRFQGLALTETPPRPFAWVLKTFYPRRAPGGLEDRSVQPFYRYDLVQIYDTERVGEWDWYLVGPGRWVEQRYVGKIDPGNDPPPPPVGKWILVNLYEQTLAAYENGRMVYATLVSSGLSRWATKTGVFAVYYKARLDHMSGAVEPDRSDYYSLEDVPWVMYFDDGRALHGAYWHDGFGYKRSHGCINLSPADSYWLYHWADLGTPVQVHSP